jgi:hypothetical protein
MRKWTGRTFRGVGWIGNFSGGAAAIFAAVGFLGTAVLSGITMLAGFPPEWIFTLSLVAGTLAGLAAGNLVLLVAAERSKSRMQPMPVNFQTGSHFASPDAQRVLTERLRTYTNEHANAYIQYASMQQRPLAARLIAIFQLAGWQTDRISVPLENSVPRYFEAVEVSGHNEHLVSAVAGFLLDAGVEHIRQNVEELKLDAGNPKFLRLVHRVRIIVGHPPS